MTGDDDESRVKSAPRVPTRGAMTAPPITVVSLAPTPTYLAFVPLQLRSRNAAGLFVALALITGVRADCNDDGFDSRGNSCGFSFTPGTTLGIAIAIFIFVALLGAYATIVVRRRRMRQAPLASPRQYLQYAPAYGQSYPGPPMPMFHPPPPGPPGPPRGDVKRSEGPSSPPYQPQDGHAPPAYPPPTYAQV
ncbi:hypothetical protein FIBSPDRAFT_949838 [Athelia psychrophila]|uniref:Transmembrane protein n=1 Tax=Athelia psychrophila TaxID=1759441 RepID=A0A166PG45_9AGAM|nr:hypothetical protein FIBSPDRAFT_949838 [Fibularhizoctonia sp. CBS 109695]